MSSQITPAKLSSELLLALRENKPVQRFPEGSTLFHQGSASTGVYLVESGEVRILLPAGHRQRQLLEVVGPGTVLGLSETMAGEPYRTTAVAGDKTSAVFIPRQGFLEFLQHCDYSMEIVRWLSAELHGLYHRFHSICSHPGRPRQRALDEQLN